MTAKYIQIMRVYENGSKGESVMKNLREDQWLFFLFSFFKGILLVIRFERGLNAPRCSLYMSKYIKSEMYFYFVTLKMSSTTFFCGNIV